MKTTGVGLCVEVALLTGQENNTKLSEGSSQRKKLTSAVCKLSCDRTHVHMHTPHTHYIQAHYK